MATSKIEICNFALAQIGCNRITSLDDGSSSGQLLADFYDLIRRALLREFPWAFADAIKKLAVVSTDVIGYDFEYGYPTRCIKVKRIFDEGTAPNDRLNAEFEVKYDPDNDIKAIFTNRYEAYAQYTADIEDVTLFDSLFTEAFGYRLAMEICNQKTGNAQRKSEMTQQYQIAVYKAFQRSGLEGYKKTEWPSRYRDARTGVHDWRRY